jgi:hypothetical protein
LCATWVSNCPGRNKGRHFLRTLGSVRTEPPGGNEKSASRLHYSGGFCKMPFRHSCFTSTIAEINFGFLFQGDAYYIIQVEDSAKLFYILALFSKNMGEKTAENDIRKIVFR